MSETLQRYAVFGRYNRAGGATTCSEPDDDGTWVKHADAQRRIEELEEVLQAIADWCDAYPVDTFGEPDMGEVRRMLGDELLTKLSAHNFRHVLNEIRKKVFRALRK